MSHDRRLSLYIITVITHNAELPWHLAMQQSTLKVSFTLKSTGKKLEILSFPCSIILSLQPRSYISNIKFNLQPYNVMYVIRYDITMNHLPCPHVHPPTEQAGSNFQPSQQNRTPKQGPELINFANTTPALQHVQYHWPMF